MSVVDEERNQETMDDQPDVGHELFDDDSDAPSVSEFPLEFEDFLIEEELTDQAQHDPSMITDDDEEEDTDFGTVELTDEWTEVSLDEDVHITDDGVDGTLFPALNLHARFVLQKIKTAMNTFISYDYKRMSEEVKLYNCFAPA